MFNCPASPYYRAVFRLANRHYLGVRCTRSKLVGIIVKEAAAMNIQITKPEVEALINQRLQSGAFKDAEDVILKALQSSPPTPQHPETPPDKDIEALFAPLRGPNIDFTRNSSTGRPV